MKRVVITGLGAVTPLGNDLQTFWNNAKNGVSGAAPIQSFDASAFKTQFACEVKNFDPAKWMDKNEIRKTDLFTQYALHAAGEAITESGILNIDIDPFDIGVIWGTGQGGMSTFEAEFKAYIKNDEQPRFSPFFIPRLISNIASGMISIKYHFMGINYTTTSACATSNTAIMDAFNYIRLGKAKVIISGGSEATINPSSIGGFNASKALSTLNDDPQKASRPFDISRDGFVIGEGAGALVLEEREHAIKRGATIYAELGGAAMTADAYHLTAPHPEGLGAARAMQLALDEAGMSIIEVDYLNAHSTSTPAGDICEMKALSNLLGDGENKLSVSATKSMTGHLLGAAGAIEAILCVMAIKENVIPPTINTLEIDPQISQNINIVTQLAEHKEVKVCLSNAFGFGGHNASVVFCDPDR